MVWNMSGGYSDTFERSHPVDNPVIPYHNDNKKQVKIKLSNLLTKCPPFMLTYWPLFIGYGLESSLSSHSFPFIRLIPIDP